MNTHIVVSCEISKIFILIRTYVFLWRNKKKKQPRNINYSSLTSPTTGPEDLFHMAPLKLCASRLRI